MFLFQRWLNSRVLVIFSKNVFFVQKRVSTKLGDQEISRWPPGFLCYTYFRILDKSWRPKFFFASACIFSKC